MAESNSELPVSECGCREAVAFRMTEYIIRKDGLARQGSFRDQFLSLYADCLKATKGVTS